MRMHKHFDQTFFYSRSKHKSEYTIQSQGHLFICLFDCYITSVIFKRGNKQDNASLIIDLDRCYMRRVCMYTNLRFSTDGCLILC